MQVEQGTSASCTEGDHYCNQFKGLGEVQCSESVAQAFVGPL